MSCASMRCCVSGFLRLKCQVPGSIGDQAGNVLKDFVTGSTWHVSAMGFCVCVWNGFLQGKVWEGSHFPNHFLQHPAFVPLHDQHVIRITCSKVMFKAKIPKPMANDSFANPL